MPALVIFTRMATLDPDELAAYSRLAPAAGKGHALTALAAYGKFEVLEGEPIEGAVVLQFPSLDEARAWYDSPAYREAVKHRFAGARYNVFMIEGLG